MASPDAKAAQPEVKAEPTFFKVGETLKCLKYVERVDGRASILAGELVKVTQSYPFIYNGVKCQDITVQKGDDAPIAVLVSTGCFARVESP